MKKRPLPTAIAEEPAPRRPAQKPDPLPPRDDEPDEAVRGRDRLIENERRPMDPGLFDSAHS